MSAYDGAGACPVRTDQPTPTGMGGNLVLDGFELLRARRGNIFRMPLPGFKPTVFAGPDAVRQVLVESRDNLLWRTAPDPVTQVLGRGLLVVDGDEHAHHRGLITPWLHRRHFAGYVDSMVAQTDRVMREWPTGSAINMVDEMRRVSLLILFQTLFSTDVWTELPRLWRPILAAIDAISPGAWLVWPGAPRLRPNRELRTLDDFLYWLIMERRRMPTPPDDLLTHLLDSGMDDATARDQILTLLIAGHDTNTALMTWTLALLGTHPDWMVAVQGEIDERLRGCPPALEELSQMRLLDRVIQESLRLYPPIHLGNRLASQAFETSACSVPAGSRVVYSIYLTHRDASVWHAPDHFWPDRFAESRPAVPYAYVPFGGGPRNCVGSAFGKIEAAAVLARVLQVKAVQLEPGTIRPHMGATLMPHPGVWMHAHARPGAAEWAP
jgi:cytochrome P450